MPYFNEDKPVTIPEYRTVILEKIRLGCRQIVEQYLLDPQCEINPVEWCSHQVEISIRGYLWGEHQKAQVISHPIDWWEAFKERFFPRWALKRWPIKYRHHYFNVDIIYPQMKISLPHETHVLKLSYFAENDVARKD